MTSGQHEARVSIILLAAGGSTRMRGDDKLTRMIEGEALLRRTARIACASDSVETIVVLGAKRAAREACLSDLPVCVIANRNWESGMGVSLACGARAVAKNATGILIMLADMPAITSTLINRLITEHKCNPVDAIIRPRTEAGKMGNPVLFGVDYLQDLQSLSGDEGARSLCLSYREKVRFVHFPSDAALTDLDTPEAWDAWSGGTGD